MAANPFAVALGDSEEIPVSDRPEDVPFLEARIDLLTDSVKKLEMFAKVKDAEDKVYSLVARYKTLERATLMGETTHWQVSIVEERPTVVNTNGVAVARLHQWASVCVMISQARGSPGKMLFRDLMLGFF